MKNYQSIYFKNYYAQDENGNYVEVSRKVCFAPAEEPTKDNPYKQRFYYDKEADYAVRLQRNQANEDLHRFNSSSLKKEERYRNKKFSCIWKNTSNCDQNCIECNEKNTSRTVELDRNWNNDNKDGMESYFSTTDETAGIATIIENKELLEALFSVLKKLSPEDLELWNLLKNKTKKKEMADKLFLSIDGVRYRENKLYEKLRSDETLKKFFKKD